MDNSNGTPRSVVAVLEEVGQWRSEAEVKHQTELSEVDKEVENLQTAMSNLQQQLEALARFREELVGKADHIVEEETARSYDAIFGALQAQAASLAERAALVVATSTANEAAVKAYMEEHPEVAELEAEVEQFKTSVEPTLENLPASYRTVIQSHHEGVVARLDELLAAAASAAGPVQIEAEELAVDVVYAVDAPEGQAELVMFVLPVDEAVHTGWQERQEDLQVCLAARVVEGLYKACHAQNLAGVQAMFGGHQGLLAIEVELPEGVDRDPLAEAIQGALAASLQGVAELEAAKLAAGSVLMVVDHLLPPEEPEEEEVSGE